jgi:plastocyanin
MINKLFSNLSFNPSMVEQLSFYSRRLKKEESVRRLGLILLAMSMLVQAFAANFPAEKSLASSDNHIINGIKSRDDILRAWDNSSSDVAKIYSKFGVTRQDIARLPSRPNDTIRSNANNYWSIGRHSLSGYSNISGNYKDMEIAVDSGGTTVYLRPLRAWDTVASYSTYAAFKGKNSTTGEDFWILVDCGNYTQIGKGRPPKPELQVKKSIVDKPKKVKAGDEVKFRVEFRNKKKDSLAEDVVLSDKLQRDKYDVLNHQNLKIGRDNTMEKKIGNLPYSNSSRVFDIKVRVKQEVQDFKKLCNSVKLSASNADTVKDEVCTNLEEEEPEEPNVPPGQFKEAKNLTQNLSGEEAADSTVRPGDTIEFTLTTTNSNDKDIKGYEIIDYVGDIIEYAELDQSHLASQSGRYEASSKEIIFENVTLPAKSEAVKTIRFKIKSSVPSTNTPSGVTTSFDCKISNEYGDEISMNVACPLIKNVETLPNTGPGEAIAFAFTGTMVGGYFFARSRLLGKELAIAKHNVAMGDF